MNYVKDGLSIDETKNSALILGFLITIGFAMWQVYELKEVSDNVLTLLFYEITAITGINIMKNRKEDLGGK